MKKLNHIIQIEGARVHNLKNINLKEDQNMANDKKYKKNKMSKI